VGSRKRIAKFLINDCGLCELHGGKLQKAIRSVLDEIDLQHFRNSEPCRLFANRLEMPFLTKGTILIFDEFFDRENEFKAFMDWRRIYRKNIRIVGEVDNYSQICVQLQ